MTGVRSAMKVHGERLVSCSSKSFSSKVAPQLPEALRAALNPVLEIIAQLTRTIRGYDKTIEAVAAQRYPQTQGLRQVQGGRANCRIGVCVDAGAAETFCEES